MEERRPKASIADLFNTYLNFNNNKYLEKIALTDRFISSTIYDIKIKNEEKDNIVRRNREILEEINVKMKSIANNTSSLKHSLNSIDKSLKNIDDNQKNQTQINIQQLEIQRREEIISIIQLLQNEQQINLQKLSLIELEIQSKIALKKQKESEKQKELKKVVFTIHKDLEKILCYNDNVSKFISLLVLNKEITKNNIKPNELEDLNEKIFASDTLKKIERSLNDITENLSLEEKETIREINSYPENIKKLNNDIEEIGKSINLKEQIILKCNNDLNVYRIKNANLNNQTNYLKNRIKSINEGKYIKPTFKTPIIILIAGMIFFVLTFLKLTSIWQFTFSISILLFLIATTMFILKFYNTPERVKRRTERQLDRNTKFDYLSEIDKIESIISSEKFLLEKLKQNLITLNSEREKYKDNYKLLIEKYPKINEQLVR